MPHGLSKAMLLRRFPEGAICDVALLADLSKGGIPRRLVAAHRGQLVDVSNKDDGDL